MANPETFVDRARRVVRALASGEQDASHVVRIGAALSACQALVNSDPDTDGVVRLRAQIFRSLLRPTYARCSRAGLVVPEAWFGPRSSIANEAEMAVQQYARDQGRSVDFVGVERVWIFGLK